MFLPASVLLSLCLASSMYRFIPPLSVLAPHDSYFSGLRANQLTILGYLRVVYPSV